MFINFHAFYFNLLFDPICMVVLFVCLFVLVGLSVSMFSGISLVLCLL